MLKDVEISDSIRIREWNPGCTDFHVWLYDQMMGETERGDKLEPRILSNNGMTVECGLLWGVNGNLKGVIPEMFSAEHGNEYICINPNGIARGQIGDDPVFLGNSPISLDEATKKFLAGENVWV